MERTGNGVAVRRVPVAELERKIMDGSYKLLPIKKYNLHYFLKNVSFFRFFFGFLQEFGYHRADNYLSFLVPRIIHSLADPVSDL